MMRWFEDPAGLVHAELRRAQGEVLRNLDDRAGGTFDAAGNFDDVLGASSREYRLLKYVEPDGQRCDAMFNRHQMEDLLHDIDIAMNRAESPISRRGLDRLRAMAIRCRDADDDDDLYVWFVDSRPTLSVIQAADGFELLAPPSDLYDNTRASPPPPAPDTP